MSNYNLKQIIIYLLLNKYCIVRYNDKLISVRYHPLRLRQIQKLANYYIYDTPNKFASGAHARRLDYIKLLSKSFIANDSNSPIHRAIYITEDEMHTLRQYVKS